MALSKTTRDHDEIRGWAEARGAVPAKVKGSHRDVPQVSVLRPGIAHLLVDAP